MAKGRSIQEGVPVPGGGWPLWSAWGSERQVVQVIGDVVPSIDSGPYGVTTTTVAVTLT